MAPKAPVFAQLGAGQHGLGVTPGRYCAKDGTWWPRRQGPTLSWWDSQPVGVSGMEGYGRTMSWEDEPQFHSVWMVVGGFPGEVDYGAADGTGELACQEVRTAKVQCVPEL